MDETRRAALEAELRDALREREQLTQRLNHVIAYLSARLGIPEPANDQFSITTPNGAHRSSAAAALVPPPAPVRAWTPPATPPAAQDAPTGRPRPDPADLVREGEFSGLSAAKAAVSVLNRVGSTRPLTTKELHAAVTKGGVQVKDRGTLFRSMYRNERIAHVGRALWGLAEWYPDRPNDERQQDAETEAELAEAEDLATVDEDDERS